MSIFFVQLYMESFHPNKQLPGCPARSPFLRIKLYNMLLICLDISAYCATIYGIFNLLELLFQNIQVFFLLQQEYEYCLYQNYVYFES